MLVWSNVPPGDFVLTAKATDDAGAVAVSDPVHIMVRPPAPTIVTVWATDPRASEPGVLTGVDPGVFTFDRSGGTNIDLTVFYSLHGTARNGVDYVAITNSVVIPKGAWSAEVPIYPLADRLAEGLETVVLRLEPLACIAIYPPPPECYVPGRPAEAVVFIADNPPPTNALPVVQIVRPHEGMTFVAPANIGILTDTVDRDGYVGKVEFFEGANKIGEEIKLFFVAPPPGTHIPYEMVWSNVPPGRYTLTAKATDDQGASGLSAPVHIAVLATNPPPTNLPPVVTIVATDPIAAEGTNCWRWPGLTNPRGTNTATFVVRRLGATNADLTVAYRIGGTASNGVDYAGLPGTITIPAGKRAASIVVVPIDDALPEPIETVLLELRPPPLTTDPPPAYVVGFPRRAGAIIVDNDRPRPGTAGLADRTFHLQAPGTNGLWFRLEASTNLLDWSALCTNAVTDGAIHFIDADAPGLPLRFYRAVPLPEPPPDDGP